MEPAILWSLTLLFKNCQSAGKTQNPVPVLPPHPLSHLQFTVTSVSTIIFINSCLIVPWLLHDYCDQFFLLTHCHIYSLLKPCFNHHLDQLLPHCTMPFTDYCDQTLRHNQFWVNILLFGSGRMSFLLFLVSRHFKDSSVTRRFVM